MHEGNKEDRCHAHHIHRPASSPTTGDTLLPPGLMMGHIELPLSCVPAVSRRRRAGCGGDMIPLLCGSAAGANTDLRLHGIHTGTMRTWRNGRVRNRDGRQSHPHQQGAGLEAGVRERYRSLSLSHNLSLYRATSLSLFLPLYTASLHPAPSIPL